MRSRAILEQFEAAQRESELIVEQLRKALPAIRPAHFASHPPRLTVVPATAPVHGKSATDARQTSALADGRLSYEHTC